MVHSTLIVLCAVLLAMSSALPFHHEWRWKTQSKTQDHATYSQSHKWSWTKPHQSSHVKVQQDGPRVGVCSSAVGNLTRANGEKIYRSYHLCSQENPAPEMENVVECYYTTALSCCLSHSSGLPVSNHTIAINQANQVTVKFYSSNNKSDLCFVTTASESVPSCLGKNCLRTCLAPDKVCLGNTVTGHEDSCPDFDCQCKEGYSAPDCCECELGFTKVNDECKRPCEENVIICQNGECTCQRGFGGPDCCQCRNNAVSCTDTACVCKKGYVGSTCCECAPDFYRSSDRICKAPCEDNVVGCQNGVCTCRAGFGGPDCCQCRHNAVPNTCTDSTCQCQEGYTPRATCCECDDNFYRSTDGTCQAICTENAVNCTLNGCTVCMEGYSGTDCCTKICTSVRDIYFVVDATHSNDVTPFCQEMYSLELLTEAINPGSSLSGTRVSTYLYPMSTESTESDMRYLKERNCGYTVESIHKLMDSFTRRAQHGVLNKIGGTTTLPAYVLNLVAEDIKSEISSENAPRDRQRIIVTLTDGNNDGSEAALKKAVQKVKNVSSSVTLIAAGIANAINTNDVEAFTDQVKLMAGGVERNTVITTGDVTDSGIRLGIDLIEVMKNNGAICEDQAANITARLQKDSMIYCRCNLRQDCQSVCSEPKVCRKPPTSQCTDLAQAPSYVAHEFAAKSEIKSLEDEIVQAVKNVLDDLDPYPGK